jgi:hypothetical protein
MGLRALKRQLHGHENKLRHAAPPPVTLRPYYPLVVNCVIPTAATDTYYAPTDVINALVTQLGLSAQTKTIINIKVSRVDVYGMATASSPDRPAVSLDCSSLVASMGDPSTPGPAEVWYGVIKKLSDQGNLSQAAVVSYSWPLHMADLPLNHNSVFTIASASGNVANTLVRFHVLWTSADVVAPQVARSLPSPSSDEDDN